MKADAGTFQIDVDATNQLCAVGEKYAARRDPSLDNSRGGMTANPWPSSDWVAYASERGPAAALLLLAAFGLITMACAPISFQSTARLAVRSAIAISWRMRPLSVCLCCF